MVPIDFCNPSQNGANLSCGPTLVDRRNWHTEWVISTTCTVTSCSYEVALGMIVLHFAQLKQDSYSCFRSLLIEQGSEIPWSHPTFSSWPYIPSDSTTPRGWSSPLTSQISYLSSFGYILVPCCTVYTCLTYLLYKFLVGLPTSVSIHLFLFLLLTAMKCSLFMLG